MRELERRKEKDNVMESKRKGEVEKRTEEERRDEKERKWGIGKKREE